VKEHLTRAQEQLLKLINDRRLAPLIGSTMAEIAIELGDAKLEAAHWKQAMQFLRAEIKTLASVLMHERGQRRLVVTERELRALPVDLELHVEVPEPGVRVYELRPKAPAEPEPGRILQ